MFRFSRAWGLRVASSRVATRVEGDDDVRDDDADDADALDDGGASARARETSGTGFGNDRGSDAMRRDDARDAVERRRRRKRWIRTRRRRVGARGS